MRLHPPLPIDARLAPSYLAGRASANRDFAFTLPDAQGACCRGGVRVHSAVDWFAPGGTPLAAPLTGVVFDARRGTSTTGQVYGGVIGIEAADGLCVVMRHVDPAVGVGARVDAGQQVGAVSRWDSGPAHAHVEVWRSRSGGYAHANMVDPAGVEWTTDAATAAADPLHRLEELPHDHPLVPGLGPVVVGQAAGYADTGAGLVRARAVAVTNTARGRPCSVLRGRMRSGPVRYFVLWWAPGTHGAGLAGVRFGPWADPAARKRTLEARERNTGRAIRAFDGRASLYPWPV